MRPLPLLFGLLLLAACTKQPHHEPIPAATRASVERALVSCLEARGLDIGDASPTDRRRLDNRIALLAGHAQDDHRAMAGIRDGRLSAARVRAQSRQMLQLLGRERHGAEPHPIHLQLQAMPELDTDQLCLLRVLTRELILSYTLRPPADWDSWEEAGSRPLPAEQATQTAPHGR